VQEEDANYNQKKKGPRCMVDEGAWDKQRIGIGASPTPPCWLSLRASILRVLGYRPRAAESQE